MQSCTLGLKKYVLQLESSTVGSDIERENLDGLVAHGKSVKKNQMLFEVSVRNGKICKTLVRSQLEQCAISGYRVQERLCDTEVVQGKVSRMTSPMRQKGEFFATRAKLKLSLRGEERKDIALQTT